MSTTLSPRTTTLLLIFVVLGLYYPLLFAPLCSLDDPGMYTQLLNSDTFTLHGLLVPGASGTYYRPLLMVSFLGDRFIWGLEASFMHLENILFHLANCLMLYALARRAGRLVRITSPWPPFLAALFFAVDPLVTESVNWISGRTDLLACFFLLLSVYLVLRPRTNHAYTFLAALSMLVACLAKDTAVFLLPALLIMPWYLPQPQGNTRTTFRQTIAASLPQLALFTAAGAGYFAFRALAFSHGDLGAQQVLTHVVGGQRDGLLLTLHLVLKAAGFYVKKLFWPLPLNFAIVHVAESYIMVGILLVACLVWLLFRRTLTAFFFLAAASIGSSALLVPLLKITWTPLAERYMYIPLAFFLVGICLCAAQFTWVAQHRRLISLLTVVLLVVGLWFTAQRNLIWQDNLALFQDTVQKSPDFVPAQNQLALALYEKGRIQEANALLLRMNTTSSLINFQYGLISKAAALENQKDYTGAHRFLLQALADPGKHEVQILQRLITFNDRAVLQGRAKPQEVDDEQMRFLQRLQKLTGDPFCSYQIGRIQVRQGNRAAAKDSFTKAWQGSPPSAFYHEAAKKLAERL